MVARGSVRAAGQAVGAGLGDRGGDGVAGAGGLFEPRGGGAAALRGALEGRGGSGHRRWGLRRERADAVASEAAGQFTAGSESSTLCARSRLRAGRCQRGRGGVGLHGAGCMPSPNWSTRRSRSCFERWGDIDGGHRKLAHRGSCENLVEVSPSTLDRELAAQGLVLPAREQRTPAPARPLPDWIEWKRHQIRTYDRPSRSLLRWPGVARPFARRHPDRRALSSVQAVRNALVPQQTTAPSDRVPHESLSAAATLVKVPSGASVWPSLLSPQHEMVPSAVIPQV